ncbi:MAG: hypothetical protein AVDCRST_MAG10-2496, partial [uncultured Acidimicrobiales bacterium]
AVRCASASAACPLQFPRGQDFHGRHAARRQPDHGRGGACSGHGRNLTSRRERSTHHWRLHRRRGPGHRFGSVRVRSGPLSRQLAGGEGHSRRRRGSSGRRLSRVRRGGAGPRGPEHPVSAPDGRGRASGCPEPVRPGRRRLHERRRGPWHRPGRSRLHRAGQRQCLLGRLGAQRPAGSGHAEPGGDRAGQGRVDGSLAPDDRRRGFRRPAQGVTAGERQGPRHRAAHRRPETCRRKQLRTAL